MTTDITRSIENQYKPVLNLLDNARCNNFVTKALYSKSINQAKLQAQQSLTKIRRLMEKCQKHIGGIQTTKGKGGKRTRSVRQSRNFQRTIHQKTLDVYTSISESIQEKVKLL